MKNPHDCHGRKAGCRRLMLVWVMICTLLPIPAIAAKPGAVAQKIELKSGGLPGLPGFSQGGLVGKLGNFLIAAAAPQTPRSDGTLSIWTCPLSLETGSLKSWQESTVTVPAWAASARWEERLIVAGGMQDGKPVSSMSVLSVDDSGTVKAERLPDLPQPLAGAGAAMIGSTLYVFGGVSSIEPAVFEKKLWKLDFTDGIPAQSWREGEGFPNAPRAFFAVTAQYGMLGVFGGIEPGLRVSRETWVYRPAPIEATRYIGWKRVSDLPHPSARASAVALGQASVMLAGGIQAETVDRIPPVNAATRQDERPWLYHTVTDAWCAFDKPLPASDSMALKVDPDVWLVGRETTQVVTFPRMMRNLAAIDYSVVIGYFLVLATIGFYFSKQESSAEFSLGNRKVKWWAAGISMFATGASAISFMAIPALAFATNLVWTLPVVAMLIPAYFITAYFIFPLLRRMEITSTYEYLERRFNNPLRLIASAQCILIQTIARTAVVLVLPALAIASVTGMNVFLSVLLMGILTTIYTSVGGFESVIWTEVFQGVLKFIAPLAMVIVAIVSLPGGFGEFWKTSGDYGKFEFALVTWDVTVPAIWILLVSYLLQFTVVKAGDQPIIQRVFSAPLHEVRRVTAMEATCGILIGILSNVLGIAIFSYFRAHPEQFSPTAQNDQIVPLFVTQAMPPGFAGMVIAAIFASAMATVASAMNSVATIYTEDFYPKIRPQATDQQRLRTLKITSYVVGIIGTSMALLLAGTNPKSLMVVWSQIVSLMGGGVVGVYSLGMFTKRVNGFGAVCGAIASIVITLLVKLSTPLHWSTYMPIAILSCMVVGYLCSLFSPQTKDLAGLTVFTPKKNVAEEL
ncbi:sodium/solute symporter [bacterium]|nr:sodium/solute symporter [bacterium]